MREFSRLSTDILAFKRDLIQWISLASYVIKSSVWYVEEYAG
jgi:hypothetical protein